MGEVKCVFYKCDACYKLQAKRKNFLASIESFVSDSTGKKTKKQMNKNSAMI